MSARALHASRLAGRSLAALVLAGIVAIVGNIAWYLIAGAVGEGARLLDAVGGVLVIIAPVWVVLLIVRERGLMIGVLCAGIVVIGTIGGDIFILNHLLKGRWHDGIKKDHAAMVDVLSRTMVVAKISEEGQVVGAVSDEHFEEMVKLMGSDAAAALSQLSAEGKEMLVQEFVNAALDNMSSVAKWKLLYNVEASIMTVMAIGAAFMLGFRQKAEEAS
jgi:hypothetical protein